MSKSIDLTLFYRLDNDGNAVILNEDGTQTTRIELDSYIGVPYPVGSTVSVLWEHPEGIVLTVEDAERIGVVKE